LNIVAGLIRLLRVLKVFFSKNKYDNLSVKLKSISKLFVVENLIKNNEIGVQ